MLSHKKLHLGLLIHLANQFKDQLINQHFCGADITAAQFKVLINIYKGITSPVEISRWLMMDAGAMSRMVDRMVKRDLIVRSIHPQDKRQVVVQLTRKSHELCEHYQSMVLPEFLGELTTRLTPEEALQLEQLLLKMLPDEITTPYLNLPV